MHPLLKEGSDEAMRIFDNIPELNLDWRKLRLDKLPNNLKDAEFLRILKNSTTSISTNKLKSVLYETLLKFKDTIGDKKWFAVLNDPMYKTKSYSLFNLLLALNLFPELANTMQGILLMSKKFEFPASYSGFTYVSFEDVLLSPDNVTFSMNNVKHMPRIVVSPFIGESPLKLLNDIGIDVIYGDKLRQFVKFDPSKLNNFLESKYESYPVLVPHRVLDQIVSFPEVYDKILINHVKTPFGSGSYTRYSYLVGDIFNQFVTII